MTRSTAVMQAVLSVVPSEKRRKIRPSLMISMLLILVSSEIRRGKCTRQCVGPEASLFFFQRCKLSFRLFYSQFHDSIGSRLCALKTMEENIRSIRTHL